VNAETFPSSFQQLAMFGRQRLLLLMPHICPSVSTFVQDSLLSRLQPGQRQRMQDGLKRYIRRVSSRLSVSCGHRSARVSFSGLVSLV
jgi:hypothetical protein